MQRVQPVPRGAPVWAWPFLSVPQEAGSGLLGTQHVQSSGGDACGLPRARAGVWSGGADPQRDCSVSTRLPAARMALVLLAEGRAAWRPPTLHLRSAPVLGVRLGTAGGSSGESLRFRRGEERRRECGAIRVKVTCEPWDWGAGSRQQERGRDQGLV